MNRTLLFFIITVVAVVVVLSPGEPARVYAGTLLCTVATSCPTGTVVFRMYGTSNSHAELPSQSNYSQLVCCTGVTGLGTSCSGTSATILKLSSTTNAHVEQNTQFNYANNVCMSVPSGGSISVGYQASDCAGFDTTIGSMAAATNAHVGNGSAYATKICASASGVPQSLSFSISDNSIGFGTLSSGSARYATGDTLGSASDSADAHTFSVSTNAANGYVVSIRGTTLTHTNPAFTVLAIGPTAVVSSPGTEQFGMRVVVNAGMGLASAPYNTANWAFDTVAFPDQIASGIGDGVTTVFGARYIGNISASTEAGNYSATLTYTATASF